MKNNLRLITALAVVLACCTPLTGNAAPKKSSSPSPSPMASATPTTKSSPKAKTTTSPATKSTNSPAPKTTTTDSGKTTTDPNKARAIPFHGNISSVDTRAKTFTIAGKEHSRTFRITDKTTMTKAGAPATMKDVVANEEVRGSYWKVMDGTLEAKTVKLGPKTDAEKAADEKRKTRKQEKEKEKDSAEPSPSATP
jgi:hypothetical protein